MRRDSTRLPVSSPARHGRHVAVLLACLAVALPASAGYNFWTGEYTFTRADLQQALDKRFPATLSYAQVISVQLSHPRLSLDATGNRLITRVDARLTNAVMPSPPVNGSLSLNSGIRYDATRHAMLLDNPTVENVQVDGVDGQYNQQLNAIGAVAAQQLLKDYPIYTFRPDELRVGG
jgi:hypothetical protein